MEFRIKRTSTSGFGSGEPKIKRAYQKEDGGDWYIEITFLEELLKLQSREDEEIIVGDGYIEIYDTYRE